MKIKKIQLIDYKRFKNLTIDLGDNPKRIIALVGPNGCGKSSVFDAMLFMHAKNYGYTIGGSGIQGDKYHALQENEAVSYQNVKMAFDNEALSNHIGAIAEKTIFSFRSAFRYNFGLNVQEVKAVEPINSNNYGAGSATALDAKMEQNYRLLYAKYNKYQKDNDARPSDAKAHIVGELNEVIMRCLNIQIDNLGNIENNEGSIFFKKEDTEKVFEFNVLSAGEKEVVDILLDLYLRKDYYTDTIYIVDEPELHLNTSIQRKLLIEINKIIPENCQIWIATHSIGFLRALQEELDEDSDIIEFSPDNQWAREEYTLVPSQKSYRTWRRIFSTALDDLTELVSPKRIIYCEGKGQPTHGGEEGGFDAQVYNTIFGEKYTDTLFVSSGGNTELDQRSEIAIRILSKVFADLKILVLKDRDMVASEIATEVDRQNYLDNNPENHRVLIRHELENYLFDKEILQRYCAENSLVFDEVQYDEFVTDIVNQNIKDEIGRIKKSVSLNTSIDEDKFKINLSKVVTPETQVYRELEKVIFERE